MCETSHGNDKIFKNENVKTNVKKHLMPITPILQLMDLIITLLQTTICNQILFFCNSIPKKST